VEEDPGLRHLDQRGVCRLGGDGLLEEGLHLLAELLSPLGLEETLEVRVILRPRHLRQCKLGKELSVRGEVFPACFELLLELSDVEGLLLLIAAEVDCCKVNLGEELDLGEVGVLLANLAGQVGAEGFELKV